MSATSFSVVLRFIPVMAIARSLLILILSLLIASCGSTDTWRISTRDGRQFLCEGEPQFQTKTGYYRYRNFQGRDALIRADEVVQIEQDS
jgi:hypothetical protein